MKRTRETVWGGVERAAQNMLREAEANALLEHQSDATEGMMMTGDDAAAASAYGGDYYLQEQYMRKLDKHHRAGTDVTSTSTSSNNGSVMHGEASKAVNLLVNAAMAYAPFFALGHDFPAIPPPSQHLHTMDEAKEDAAAAATDTSLWSQANGTDMDIIVPVVSPGCPLAMSASQGSTALAELKRLVAREKANRAVMDTSRSALAQLMHKDSTGRTVAATTSNNVDDLSADVLTSGEAGGAERTMETKEAEALRRQIRIERERLAGTHATAAEKAEEKTATKVHKGEVREQATTSTPAKSDDGVCAEVQEERRRRLREQREGLPIFACKEALLRCIGENVVTIVVGETGSGKTTQLVQYLHAQGYTRGRTCGEGPQTHMLIGCTQPRRLAAMGVARRVSEEMNCDLGGRVGYAIHLDDCTSEATEVKFMTDGVMLREVVQDAAVSRYSVIVLDEAHERSVDTDVLMGVLKLALRRRGDLKLIVTSATMEVAKFSRFFGNAPCFTIPGRSFPVQVQYAPQLVRDYVAESVYYVCQLHLQMPLEGKHDILVFMTGSDDVYGTCELIRRRLRELSPRHLETLLLLPCLSEAASLNRDLFTANNNNNSRAVGVLDETPPGMRKCVVATNVAETSLTIDGVRYVVDCGFMKTNVFRPKIGMNTLQRYPVSQAQAEQRKGRAGRTTEGRCFRLYTEEQFAQEMLPSAVPEIQRTSVESVVLLLKSIGVARLAEFDFMDAPPVVNTRNSMWHLWVLGLLDDAGQITQAGRRALDFPLAPALGKLLLESAAHGCSIEVARVVALISADPKNLFELPKGREEIAQQHHGRFFANDSDHLTLLNVLSQFIDHGQSRQWAQDHFLHVPTLLRACEVLEQLLERLRRLRLPLSSCGYGGLDTVRCCLCKAFCLQAAQRSGSHWNAYRPLLNMGVVAHLHPGSALCGRPEMPPYVIYNDLLFASKEYLVLVTAVEPEWLIEGSRGLFYARHGLTGSRATVRTPSVPQPAPAQPLAMAQQTLPVTTTNNSASGAPRQPASTSNNSSNTTTRKKFAMLSKPRRANV